MKALARDPNGLAIWYERLEEGPCKWPTRSATSLENSAPALSLLLDDVGFTRIQRLPVFDAHAVL